ncbi:MAG TPA: hypothetical protein VL524_18440 [Gemmatimonadaceae bacterium]|jgi:hypothetical protein|nr:hypothetical protein [Gemmatimonadaceae bacterium]
MCIVVVSPDICMDDIEPAPGAAEGFAPGLAADFFFPVSARVADMPGMSAMRVVSGFRGFCCWARALDDAIAAKTAAPTRRITVELPETAGA